MHEIANIWFGFWHWVQEVLGLNYGLPGHTVRWYNWGSADGSIILPPLITLAGLAVLFWWHNRCHETTCHWRVGKHEFKDDDNNVTYKLCKKHHPALGKDHKLFHHELLAFHKKNR
jgi:hypothetical protein